MWHRLQSVFILPKITHFCPKEKVGQNPPDNASDDPSKLEIIRSRSSGSKRGWFLMGAEFGDVARATRS